MEGSEVVLPLGDILVYAVSITTAFFVPYLIWLHNRVIENKQAIAVNTAHDKNVEKSIDGLTKTLNDVRDDVAEMRRDINQYFINKGG